MELTNEQLAEIEDQRATSTETRRPSAPALEEILWLIPNHLEQEVPILIGVIVGGCWAPWAVAVGGRLCSWRLGVAVPGTTPAGPNKAMCIGLRV